MPFPPEILDIIFSFLYDDKQSLKACSLVARVWLQPVRAHFFHVVLTPVNVDEFIELAANAGSFISGTLQDIALTRNWDAIQVSVFPSLKMVTCMVIHNMDYAPAPLHTVLLGMPSVTHLYLDQVSFESFSETTLALCLFPALQSVSLCDVSWLLSEPSPHLLPATVTHLSLTLCYQRDVFNWLLNQRPIPHLNLGTSVAPSDAPSIGEYLAHCGPALRSLRLGFSSFDAGGDAEDFLAPSISP
ncbi:hypothetical protein CPB85DRAFT_1434810 [Mucidula mucida]|nr:hypothetical protein CPB85DRAFT_1434810 [Mucidula mucida]